MSRFFLLVTWSSAMEIGSLLSCSRSCRDAHCFQGSDNNFEQPGICLQGYRRSPVRTALPSCCYKSYTHQACPKKPGSAGNDVTSGHRRDTLIMKTIHHSKGLIPTSKRHPLSRLSNCSICCFESLSQKSGFKPMDSLKIPLVFDYRGSLFKYLQSSFLIHGLFLIELDWS